ncbi:Hypothetical protein, putative [Bodo saltans]|uniref:Uncharacterized protein n=1 Tax=Bodo saltans TaxID=75058 RepID=A0A0S4KET2_BODSA|nr:Hypothetical protein, putative [Bodo saltans]|eukprot:CUI14194.1 Hypothetical protein, putative [Bodo saltans]
MLSSSPSSSHTDEEELLVAERDRTIRQTSAKNTAYRDALEEISGELYAAAFAETFKRSFDLHLQRAAGNNE